MLRTGKLLEPIMRKMRRAFWPAGLWPLRSRHMTVSVFSTACGAEWLFVVYKPRHRTSKCKVDVGVFAPVAAKPVCCPLADLAPIAQALRQRVAIPVVGCCKVLGSQAPYVQDELVARAVVGCVSQDGGLLLNPVAVPVGCLSTCTFVRVALHLPFVALLVSWHRPVVAGVIYPSAPRAPGGSRIDWFL